MQQSLASNQVDVRRSADSMFPVIEKYLAGGLTQRHFCEQEGLTLDIFKYWLKKYRKTRHASPVSVNEPVTKAFVSVHTPTKTLTSSVACEVALPNGIVIRFHQPVNADLLIQLIRGGV